MRTLLPSIASATMAAWAQEFFRQAHQTDKIPVCSAMEERFDHKPAEDGDHGLYAACDVPSTSDELSMRRSSDWQTEKVGGARREAMW